MSGEVESFATTRIGEGVGMTSILVRIALHYSGESGVAPTTVVAKFATDDPAQRPMLDSLQVYAREVRFYRELSHDTPFRVPFCHTAQQATDSSDFVLILEDVGALTNIDQLVGCTWEQSCQAVRTIAPFHAQWWESDRLDDLSTTFPPLSLDGYKMLLPYLFTTGWEFTKTLVPELVSPELHAFAEQWPTFIGTLLDEVATPRTLCHGDWRADNLLIDGENLAALDFQILGIGSGLYDIAYFTSQSMTAEVRTGRDRELIDIYVAAVAEHGITIDPELAWRQYRQALMFCLIYPVNLMGGYEAADPRGQELLRTLLSRSAAAILDTNANEAIPL
jgi:Ecdysteroid kinase-like family